MAGQREKVAVAIDKDKGSQAALKWAVDNLLGKGKSVNLVHVKLKANESTKDVFLPFRCFCTRKNIQVNEVIIQDSDVAKAVSDYIKSNSIETLVMGSSPKNGFVRFKTVDIPGNVMKMAPEYCTVYVISKGKVASCRSPSNPNQREREREHSLHNSLNGGRAYVAKPSMEETDSIRSAFNRDKAKRSYGELSMGESDISFVGSARPSSDRIFDQDPFIPARLSNCSDPDSRLSFGSPFSNPRSSDATTNSFGVYSSTSQESGNFSWSGSQTRDDVEAEMRRLKQELKQTMDMYSTACKEALTAKQKALELHRWKIEEEQRLEEARQAEEAALAIAEKEKQKCRVAVEKAEAAQRIAELEAQKRINAEMKALKESEEKNRVLHKFAQNDVRYRKYSIEDIESSTHYFAESRKIGEGGYGPVYKSCLDHTEVAIKVLRPDAAQGRSQFQQEVEVLSCIRHPNMVLLLGACPEYGCLVYEYMANGSLDDRLFRRGNTPVIPWQLRFRIAAEIATGLLFLHQAKPEPLVHRDLKPGNILLDRNFVSKISDVGLARLVPPSVADSVTQYRMTSAAGTFCYIDPEYQQTGMLGIKSDIYSLGVMLLQIITAKPPMGLTHHVEKSIERGTFAQMLDPQVHDWPVEEATVFAKLALKCTELRRKDRPDLGTVVLPELNRFRMLAEQSMPTTYH
ncbi:U-box domain-containing protein 52-like isoform X2 [Salvia splendens]|uniref:U-box domain-containing protein 52-like isoform X2 n=1 Tax=Salvia splendens TaxID=180675 RepID=UPI001C2557FA|nr:U-box domain-containing protein 52-like isoform X2 [Salvia splendens]